MARVRLETFVENVNERVEPSQAGDEIIGLEDLEPQSAHPTWGKAAMARTNSLSQGDSSFGKRRAYQRKVAVAEFDGIVRRNMVVRPKPTGCCRSSCRS